MSLQIVDFGTIFLLIFCVLDISCQRVRFEQTSSQISCSAEYVCLPIRQCGIYVSLPRTQKVICEPGRGSFRKVCCPMARGTATNRPRFGRSTSRLTTEINIMERPILATNRGPNGITTRNHASRCGKSQLENTRRSYLMEHLTPMMGEWPWMVAITKQVSSGMFEPHCSGFLIDSRHILSAAHCYHDKNVTLYQAKIGNVDQTKAEIYLITRIAVPEQYRNGLYYADIAMLTLDNEVNSELANPICLPDVTILSMNLTDTGVSVAGWGTVGPRGSKSSILRHRNYLPVVSNEACNAIFEERLGRRSFPRQFPSGIDSDFICAGNEETARDACGGGYSGGPLMKQHENTWFAVGVASYGAAIECGRPYTVGIYTRVSEYMNWILDNTRN